MLCGSCMHHGGHMQQLHKNQYTLSRLTSSGRFFISRLIPLSPRGAPLPDMTVCEVVPLNWV